MDLAAELAEVDDAAAYVSTTTTGLLAALDVDVTAYCEWHPSTGTAGRVVLTPEDIEPSEDQCEVWRRHHGDDLWITHVATTPDRRAVRLTDHASSAQLSRSPTYQGCYRPSGFRFMAHLPLSLGPRTSAAVGIGRRTRDLDDDVLELFDALRTPLAGARKRLVRAGQDIDRAPLRDVTGHASTMWVLSGRARAGGAAAAPDPERLTRRQADVLALVADGCTNDQVGRRLGLSTRTVKKHLEAVYARLGVTSRAAAAARWTAGTAPGPGGRSPYTRRPAS